MTDYAFVFPGQASQQVGMAKDLHDAFPVVRELFAEADEAMGESLSRYCFDGPEEALRQTAVTQPAVFVHSIAAWRLLTEQGLDPQYTAGHSLGEYAALVAAGALDYSAALHLVIKRGQLMQQAGKANPGAMAALIGLDDAVVIDLCNEASSEGIVVAANFNAPGQVVVSGAEDGVRRLEDLARQAGAKRFVMLPVSGAFHSPLMKPAAVEMEAHLLEAPLKKPIIPVITNVTATAVDDPEQLRLNLIEQITHPVRWTESILELAVRGMTQAIEVGPGAVLKGLGRRIARQIKFSSAGTCSEIAAIATLKEEG
jgi:[acyl-carrier-protein] S-malonyltransferase